MAEPEQAPAVAPAAATETTAPVVEPVAAPVVTPEATPEVNAHETPTLLEEVSAPGEEKPAENTADAKPEGDKPKEAAPEKPVEVKPETKPEEKPAEQAPEVKPEAQPEPIKYEFKFPETLKPEAKAIGDLSSVFNEGKVAPEVAQKIIDIGSKAITDYAESLRRDQMKVFADTRADWRKQVMASEDLGGAGHQTAMAAVARMRDMLCSDHAPGTQEYEADHKALNDFMRYTGAGDNPVFLRILHRAARFFDEPSMPPSGANPPPSNGQRPGRRSLKDIYRETRESQGR